MTNNDTIVYRIRWKNTGVFVSDGVFLYEPPSVPNDWEVVKFKLVEIKSDNICCSGECDE
jgi:hypothetical protein